MGEKKIAQYLPIGTLLQLTILLLCLFLIGCGSGEGNGVGAGSGSSTMTVTSTSHSEGYAGHSVVFQGQNLGTMAPWDNDIGEVRVDSGSVTWGGATATITDWKTDKIVAYLPDKAVPGTRDLVVTINGTKVASFPFTVIPSDIEMSPAIKNAFNFIKDKMRNSEGGVYSNYKDSNEPDPVYLYGHNVTSEQMGLMLWVSAALLDHAAFEKSYQYVKSKMISPKLHLVYWAVDKTTGKAYGGTDIDNPYYNAPLDDLRVIKGLISGYMQWKDERYLETALLLGDGMLDNCISEPQDFPTFPDGLVTTGCGWLETQEYAFLQTSLVPVNYADLWTMNWLVTYEPAWTRVIKGTVKLMEAATIPSSFQFYNSYFPNTNSYSGDWEYQEVEVGFVSPAASKVKTIQSLWTAIHLARIGHQAAAQKALDFYRNAYNTDGFVSEYYNYDGSEATEEYFVQESSKQGEARIYAQIVRLAYYLGDRAFGDKLATEKILTDQNNISDDPLFGFIGVSTAEPGDADAWNTLESLLGLAILQDASVVNHVFPKEN
jgi:hypothetical protein